MDMDKIKQSIGPGIWGAVIGAAALAIIGFSWSGWMTGKTANEMAQAAIVESMIPICVGQYNADSEKVSKLAAMKKVDSWKQADFVTEQGWSIMPGATEADRTVARACASQIVG